MPITSFPTLDISKVGLDAWSQAFRDNFESLKRQDQKAKDAGKLVGRYIDESVADGAAYYVIVADGPSTVRIRLVTGVGDDYRIPYWGEETTIEKEYALRKIGWRDTYTAWAQKANAEKK